MGNFQKDTSLFSGKGEWDEAEHPRDSDGKFTSKGGGQSTTSQVKSENMSTKEVISNESEQKKDAIKHLIEGLKEIKRIKQKELVDYIKNLKPISLKINENEIIAEFDAFGARKNVYAWGNSDSKGFEYKLSHIEDLPKIIQESKYLRSKAEDGKSSIQHKGVKQWHYFINTIETDKGNFDITVNVRDKGNKNFIYEVSFRLNKKTKSN